MAALAHVEHSGIPIDVPLLHRLRGGWSSIIDRLIAAVDGPFGSGRSFRTSRFRDWLLEHDRHWPLLPSGQLDQADDTFRDMARVYLELVPIHELRSTLSGLRLENLQVGEDGRNRCMLSAYRSVTGRNQPSNAKYIYGPGTWLRGLIKPPPGHVYVYIDWVSQEIGIGAALSGAGKMMAAYASGDFDFYLGFAKQVGLAPADATKQSHGELREMIKTVVLGLGYGMGKRTLARRLGIAEADAAELIALYWRAYPEFRKWLESAVDHAMLWSSIPTVFGWPMHIEGRFDPGVAGSRPNPRTLRNFPCQGNGAEMLRLAVSLGVERGIKVVAPVHDAIAIETEIDRMQDDVATMREAMAEASRVVLGGFELGTKAEPVVYPDRYADPRGAVMWEKVMSLLPAEPNQRRLRVA